MKKQNMTIFETEQAIRVALALDYPQGFLIKTILEELDVGMDLYDYQLNVLFTDASVSSVNASLITHALLIESILWHRSNSRDIDNVNQRLNDLDSRYVEIKDRLDELLNTLDQFKIIIDQLNELLSSFNELKRSFESLFNSLYEVLDEMKVEIEFANTSLSEVKLRIREYFENRWEGFDDLFQGNLNNWYNNFMENTFPTLKTEYWNEFNTVLSNKWEDFRQNVLPGLLNDFFDRLKNESLSWWNERKRDIIGENPEITLTLIYNRFPQLAAVLDGIVATLEVLETAIGAIGTTTQSILVTVGSIGVEVTGTLVIAGAIEKDVVEIKKSSTSLHKIFHPFQPSLFSYLESKFKNSPYDIEDSLNSYRAKYNADLVKLIGDGVLSVTTLLSNSLRSISKTISDEVTSKIVGESYSKWNAVSSFYPSVVFVFKEDGEVDKPRRSQIKLRFKKDANEIDDSDIDELKEKCKKLMFYTYYYGQCRVNFVSKDKTSKTTLYVKEESVALDLLTTLCGILQIPWDASDLTFTVGPRRNKITSRTTPLDGIEVDITDYNEIFRLRLIKVVLLINGLAQPITLFNEHN